MFNKKLKKRIAELEAELKAYRTESKVYEDLHDPDRITFWRNMLKWAGDVNARKFAFEQVNKVLVRMIGVKPENMQDFYILQGCLAQLNAFLRLPSIIEQELKAAQDKFKKEDEEEEVSISDQHS